MKKLLIICFILLNISAFSQKFTISGYVKDAETGEELIGASVFVLGTSFGAYTNQYGFYSITLTKGEYKVEYSYLGYSAKTLFINLSENKSQSINLTVSAEKLETVVVSGEARDKNVSSTDMGVQNLAIQEIKTIPVLFGENDILKTIQLMPGVKSAGEGNSGFFVRGGGADQNLVLIDEAPVYNASHMLGFFSVFNGDAIKDVKLYKGAMPAEYGGRLSSVLDIKMKEGNLKEYHATGGIGTISSRLSIEGPIKKDTSSFLIAARRTYADMFLIFAKDTNLHETKLYFYDLNIKTNYKINDNNRLFLSGYFGRDVFKFQKAFGTDWGNATGTLRWVHLFSPKLFLNSTAIFSNFSNVITVNTGTGNIDLVMGITDFNWKEDLQYYLNTNNTLKFGVEAIYHTFNPGELRTDMSGINIQLQKKYALESGIHISNEQTVNDFIKLKYGVRISNFSVLGPGTTYEYDDEDNITDSSVYSGRSTIIKNYPGFEPRIAATFRLNATSSIKASFTRNNQYVHLIQSSTISLPMDYWIPSTENTPPQQCEQYSLGYFKNFKENMFETSIELYYKDLKSQIDYENGTDVFLNPKIESRLLFGIGRSYGAEFLVKKNSGKFTGWVGYTLSKTEKKFIELEPDWFPVRYDRTHDISIVGMYDLTKKIQLSATWVYSTGDAITFPSQSYEVDDFTANYYPSRNHDRIADYHRLDVGITYQAKKTEKYSSNWNFSVYNAYNHKNTYMIIFEDKESTPEPNDKQAVKVTLFPILPSITWNFTF